MITIRRGGTLTDEHHHLLALWAATCAEHVLEHFERAAPQDARPREAIEAAALAEPGVAAFVAGQVPKKVIVVPGKIVNIVV